MRVLCKKLSQEHTHWTVEEHLCMLMRELCFFLFLNRDMILIFSTFARGFYRKCTPCNLPSLKSFFLASYREFECSSDTLYDLPKISSVLHTVSILVMQPTTVMSPENTIAYFPDLPLFLLLVSKISTTFFVLTYPKILELFWIWLMIFCIK